MTSRLPEGAVFSISVVAQLVGVHQQTIRMYERAGLVEPARTAGQTRRYSAEDIERLRQVVRMVSELGVNLAGVQVALQLLKQIEDLREELTQTQGALSSTRGELERLQQRVSELQPFARRLRDEMAKAGIPIPPAPQAGTEGQASSGRGEA